MYDQPTGATQNQGGQRTAVKIWFIIIYETNEYIPSNVLDIWYFDTPKSQAIVDVGGNLFDS